MKRQFSLVSSILSPKKNLFTDYKETFYISYANPSPSEWLLIGNVEIWSRPIHSVPIHAQPYNLQIA